jgi:O-acetyl-ADP-ribose deacetylase (regulator of RNase III)
MPQVDVKLVGIEPQVVHALAHHFKDCERVQAIHGSLLDKAVTGPAEAIVSPANSYGTMDGGIDLAYLTHFKAFSNLQQRVLETYKRFGGFVPVGQAVWTHTGSFEHMPLLISAPTMTVPMDVRNTWNAYWAMKAVLQFIQHWNMEQVFTGSGICPFKQPEIKTVLVPGLCTGAGRMHPDTAARQMRKAYSEIEERGNA